MLIVTGCAIFDSADGVAVSPAEFNEMGPFDGGLTVGIPGSSLAEAGRLSVAAIPDVGEGAAAWSVELVDTHLTGPATLRFPLPELDAGEPLPVVTFAESVDGPRSLAPDVVVEGGSLVVTTGHFSVWFVDRWADIADAASRWLSDRLDQLVSSGADPPTCRDERRGLDPGYRATGDQDSRVLWCFGAEAGRPVLAAANGRGYGVSVEYTPGLSVARIDRRDFLAEVAKLMTPPPWRSGNDVELLPAGSRIDLAVDTDVVRLNDTVRFRPEPGAYLLTALDLAVGLVTMTMERAGAGRAVKSFETALLGQQCLSAFTEMATTGLGSAAEATRFFKSALNMAMDCAEMALGDADLGPILTTVVQPVLWVMAAVNTVVVGTVAMTETLFDPDGFTITIDRPSRASGLWTDPIVIVTPSSVGNAVIGMSDAQIERAAGVDFRDVTCTGGCDEAPSADLAPERYPTYLSVTTNTEGRSFRSIEVGFEETGPQPDQIVTTEEGFVLGDSVTDLRRIYGDRLERYEVMGLSDISGYVLADDGNFLIFNAARTNGTFVHEIIVAEHLSSN